MSCHPFIKASILGLLLVLLFSGCNNLGEYTYEGLRSPLQLHNCVITGFDALLENHTRVYYLQLSDTTYHACKMSNVFINNMTVGDTIK